MNAYCPHCNQKYELDASHLGCDIECVNCGGNMRFEAPASPPLAPPPPTEPPSQNKKKIRVSAAAIREEKAKLASTSRRRTWPLLAAFVGVGVLAAACFFGYKQFASRDTPGDQAGVAGKSGGMAGHIHHSAEFTRTVTPFFERHCLQCHGPDKEKGGLRVDLLKADFDDHYSLSHFQNIIDELATQNMPPEDEVQPDAEDVVAVMDALSEFLEAAKQQHNSGGGRPVRRLTRTEYINTVWDQLASIRTRRGCRTTCMWARSTPMRTGCS